MTGRRYSRNRLVMQTCTRTRKAFFKLDNPSRLSYITHSTDWWWDN